MTFLQFLGYFLLVDSISSLIIFGILYFFRKDLLLRLQSHVRGIVYGVLEKKYEESDEDFAEHMEKKGFYPKKEMRDALDDVFNLKGGDDDTTH